MSDIEAARDSMAGVPYPFGEDSYGRLKRFRFVTAAVTPDVRAILDVGCGTGSQLTKPLAEAFGDRHVVGIESDIASLDAARATGGPALLNYQTPEDLDDVRRFDLVIASEVLEHVEDPHAFLLWLRAKTEGDGCIVITVPNGFGPAEIAQVGETILTLSGIWPLIRRVKRWIAGQPQQVSATAATTDTLAVSPHINFFTRGDLAGLFASCGLDVKRYGPRTFLCGFLIDQMIAGLGLTAWNARIADRLPAWLVSDWMFELRPGAMPRPAAWRRSRLSRWRRSLNERRWGIE